MAKVAVYEGSGCPACSHYGQLAIPDTRAIMQTVQAGAIGAAAGMAADFVLQRLLRIRNPFIRAIASVAVPIGIAAFVRRQNPQMAEYIAVGGTTVGIYNLLKGLIGPRLGLAGLGEMGEEETAVDLPEIEVTEGETGALVPEIEETEGYGALVPEIEETEGLGAGEPVVEVEE